MICVAHRVGASLRQLADVSGLNRETVTLTVTTIIESAIWAPTITGRREAPHQLASR